MLWNQLIQLIFGVTMTAAQPLPPDPVRSQAHMDELLSYSCAKSVAGLLDPVDQPGPVFSNSGLVFTSIDAMDHSPLLLVNAGAGTYSLSLNKVGVNRLRFSIPVQGSAKAKTFFISYLHDPVSHSRFFDFSTGKPPMGKSVSSYTPVQIRRAPGMQANLNYGIHETAEVMLASLTEGKLQRQQMRRAKPENCEHIIRKNPALGRNLKRNLDVVEMIVMGPKPPKKTAVVSAPPPAPSRMPASVAAVPVRQAWRKR